MKKRINALVENGLSTTENGYWSISFDELAKGYGIDLVKDLDECDDVIDALIAREEVKSAEYNMDGLDVVFHPARCKNLTIKGITPMLEKAPTLVAFVAEM